MLVLGLLVIHFFLVGVGALFVAVPRSHDAGTRTRLVSGIVVLTGLFLFAYVPNPTRMHLLHALPPLVLILGGSSILGTVVVLTWVNRFLALVPIVAVSVLGVYVVSGEWPPNPVYGWGLIAVPPLLAGLLLRAALAAGRRGQVITILGWVIVVVMALPTYIDAMDNQAWLTGRQALEMRDSGADTAIKAVGYRTEVTYTSIYLGVALAALGLCWVVSKFEPRRAEQARD